MATLTSTKIKNTYDALLKASDNDAIGSSAKQITDGLGNGTPLYISTTQIGIGVTPEATYDLHVYSNAKVGGNLTVTGDLTVEGTTTTIDTQTLTVEDPLIEVASNNTSTDAVDIGWYGKYAPSGTVLYAGLFRDTGDSKFKLFRNLEEQPTTTVNTSGTGYTKADLVIGNLETTQVDLGDNEKIRFGDSDDLEIYHTGSHSYLRNSTGSLEVTTTGNLILQDASSNKWMMTNQGGGVLLYYNGGTAKLSTTSTGISVTGDIDSSGDVFIGGTTTTNAQGWGREIASINSGSSGASLTLKDSNGEWQVATYTNKFYISKGLNTPMLIDSSGRVGIGTSSPFYKLDVRTSGNIFIGVTDLSDNTSIFRLRADGGSQELLEIKADGKIGMGTDSPQRKLHLHESSSSGSFISFTNDTTGQTITDGAIVGIDDGEDMLISTYEDKNIEFRTGNIERMRIDSSGNTTFSGDITLSDVQPRFRFDETDTTNENFEFRHNGGDLILDKIDDDFSSNRVERMRIDSDGGIFFPSLGGFSSSNSDVRYNTSSDELYYQTSSKRYKSEITDLENSLDKVNNLRAVRFKDNLSQEYATGMIAEEVAEIIPEVVFTKLIDGFDEPQIEGINYSDLVPFLIKSIQELKANNDSLRARIETLENN